MSTPPHTPEHRGESADPPPARRDDPSHPPPPPHDPFAPDPKLLQIPEVLQKPVNIPDSMKRKPRSDLGGMGELMKALAFGIDFLATIAAGALIGWGLDTWFGWGHRALVVGLGIGFVVATVRLLQRTAREDAAAKAAKTAKAQRDPKSTRSS